MEWAVQAVNVRCWRGMGWRLGRRGGGKEEGDGSAREEWGGEQVVGGCGGVHEWGDERAVSHGGAADSPSGRLTLLRT